MRGSVWDRCGRVAAFAALAASVVACQRTPDGAAMTVVDETVVLRWSDPLPARTAIFDGEVVRLRAARGEVLGVQALRVGPGRVDVTLALPAANVTAFAVDHHAVTLPSTSMYGGSRGPGLYPDRLRPSAGPIAAARAAYFDVAIGRDAAAGIYRGELTVGVRRLPVELTVVDATMPPIDAAPEVWAYYDPRELARAHRVDDPMALERAYAAMFRAHGVAATPELTAESWPARRELVAGMRYVPVLLPRDRAGVAATVADWAARLAGTGQTAFAIPIDEPRFLFDQLRVRALARWVRAAGGGPGRFLYAVTHDPTWLLGDEVDVYISPFAVRPGQSRAAWTYNGTPPWAGAMVLDGPGGGPRTWGWIAFRYGVPLWYVWDAMYWRDRYNAGRDAAARDLLRQPASFYDGEDVGNLDGVLAYPGPYPSLRLKALRRGQQERALLTSLAACAGAPAAAAIAYSVIPRALGEMRARAAPAWPAADVAWETARRRLLDALSACPN